MTTEETHRHFVTWLELREIFDQMLIAWPDQPCVRAVQSAQYLVAGMQRVREPLHDPPAPVAAPASDLDERMGEWICSDCGARITEVSEATPENHPGSWRWEGHHWAHSHGQAGHQPARRFGAAPASDWRLDLMGPGSCNPTPTPASVCPRWRPEVERFADLMEAQLRANDHKPGWDGDDPLDLLARVQQESDELHGVLRKRERLHQHFREEVGKEAADVANFAMMVADVCGGLRCQTKGPICQTETSEPASTTTPSLPESTSTSAAGAENSSTFAKTTPERRSGTTPTPASVCPWWRVTFSCCGYAVPEPQDFGSWAEADACRDRWAASSKPKGEGHCDRVGIITAIATPPPAAATEAAKEDPCPTPTTRKADAPSAPISTAPENDAARTRSTSDHHSASSRANARLATRATADAPEPLSASPTPDAAPHPAVVATFRNTRETFDEVRLDPVFTNADVIGYAVKMAEAGETAVAFIAECNRLGLIALKAAEAARDAAVKERDEARSVLASLADAINTWIRENSAGPQIEHYESLHDMRGGVDTLGYKLASYGSERDAWRVKYGQRNVDAMGLQDRAAAAERRCGEAVELLREYERWLQDASHTTVCNGVHADNGMCEGSVFADRAMERVRAFLSAAAPPIARVEEGK